MVKSQQRQPSSDGPRGKPMLSRLHVRARHRGMHGHQHIDKQRRHALIMVRTAQVRVAIWATMMIAGPFSHALQHTYTSVAFVTYLSLGALLLTDWGQYAASSAELAAGDAHHDAEVTRATVQFDMEQIDTDLSRLANLTPGIEARQLARQIADQLNRPVDREANGWPT